MAERKMVVFATGIIIIMDMYMYVYMEMYISCMLTQTISEL